MYKVCIDANVVDQPSNYTESCSHCEQVDVEHDVQSRLFLQLRRE